MSKHTWFKEFSVPTYDQWREAAEKSLKGASFDAKLLTKSYEGIVRQPIYRYEDVKTLPHLEALPGEAPFHRGNQQPGEHKEHKWQVCQEISATSAKTFNQAALDDLARGQTMLHLIVDQATLAGLDPDEALPDTIGHKGVSVFCREDIEQAFQGVKLSEVPLYMNTGALGLPILSILLAHVEATDQKASELRGCIGQDPVAVLLTEGKLPCSLQTAYNTMASVTKWAKDQAPALKTILVQSNPYQDGGGNAVSELAFSLATGVDYLQAMLERGLSIEDIAARMQFSYSIGSDVFMEIAKLRAARMLWSNIVAAYGGSTEAQKMTIHARTSAWTKTIYDPYVNMLRSTTEAFSAVIGGADSLHVSAFDEAIRPANEFSRRIARNTQIILQEEAHLAKVIDPAGGSWYVEWLTDALAKKAWELFQQVEAHGGMLSALEAGFPQDLIAQSADQKAASIDTRKKRLVGTNMYANTAEQPLKAESHLSMHEERAEEARSHRLKQNATLVSSALDGLGEHNDELVAHAVKAVLHGATVGDIAKAMRREDSVETIIQPLRIHRASERFEALRMQADDFLKTTGKRPTVFLATMGPVSKHKARADFVAEFFAVGGFDVLREQAFSTTVEAAEAAVASSAMVTVICSDDDSYPEQVPPLAHAIKQRVPQMTVLVAGLPEAEQLAAYKAAGVDDCIHMRSNCYEMLRELQERIGVGS
ncbi:acyl-CoA mutase large subunit family protein [Brevibacillus brevis]|uniref:methylmalonyl-CoA mutase family protein n=1 Tax=Brevibacillus brevis TaxID=1393 RepID=UPI001F44B3C6|nr:methylmalonyl-CoA mutase family protein [Brevibacillus brevis]UIO45053.1 acyl-CoA mutase large subunit family protein [Brevibacillus brevis]